MSRGIRIASCLVAVLALSPVALGNGGGTFQIDSFFDVFTELTVGPPYPSSPPVVIGVFGQAITGGDPLPLEEISFNYGGAAPANLPLRMVAGDSGGPLGSMGAESFFDVFFEIDVPPAESFFDVFVDVLPPSTNSTAARPLVAQPQVFFVDSFFDVFFDIDISDVDPTQNTQTHHIHGEVGPGLKLTNVGLGSTYSGPDSFFDVFFEITITDPGVFNSSQPAIHATLDGKILPEPATLGLLALGGLALLRRRRK